MRKEKKTTSNGRTSLKDVDVLLFADLFEFLGPDRDADLAEMCFFKEVHVGPRLPDAAADGEGYLVVEDRLVVW